MLLDWLEHSDATCRQMAASFLGLLGAFAKETLPALSRLLTDQDQAVRDAAQEAIKRIEGS